MRAIVAGLISISVTIAHAQPEVAHAEYAVRAGIHATELVFDDDAPKGKGVLLEGEAAWRFTPWLSIGAFATLRRLRDSFHDPFRPMVYTSTVLFVDLGLRFHVHAKGAFAGLGIARQDWRDRGAWFHGPLGEVHAGYTFPRVSVLHGAPQVMLAVGRSTTTFDTWIDSAQLSVGAVF